ncbi:hypothetical protein DMUE_4966 [Dictyocoela muelleri]|nr:hypothetical protein DMUE_4966 [Dictyocoela muelleri]
MNNFPDEENLNFEEMESVVIDSNSPDNTKKAMQPLTKDMVETFLNIKRASIPFADMLGILNMSKRALIRLAKKYIYGELNDLSLYKTAGRKKSLTAKDTTFEINLIATEFSHPPVQEKVIFQRSKKN